MPKRCPDTPAQSRGLSRPPRDAQDAEEQFSRTSCRDNCGQQKRKWARLRAALKHGLNTPAEKPLQSALLCSRDYLVFAPDRVGPRGTLFVPYSCGRKFCDDCQRHQAQTLQSRLLPLAAKAGHKRLRHLVLTIKNGKRGHLAENLDDLQHCWREWRNQGRRKRHGAFWLQQVGYHARIEVTYSQNEGWHPHIHALLDCPAGYDHRNASDSRTAWERITETRTGTAAVSSWIERAKSANIAREVAKYVCKPLEIQSGGSAVLCEAAEALHKRRLYTCQGTLRAPVEEDNSAGWLYLDRLSSIVTAPSHAMARGIDVSTIICDLNARFGRDKTIRQRIPALLGCLDDESEAET